MKKSVNNVRFRSNSGKNRFHSQKSGVNILQYFFQGHTAMYELSRFGDLFLPSKFMY